MSAIHVQRLRAVQAEFDAMDTAIRYVNRHWQTQNIHQEVGDLKPKDFSGARQNLEATYFIRLYAEFEGLLKDHLATNHPRIITPDRPKVDWLISRIIQVEGISVERPLRLRLDAVRDYRNSIAHRSRRIVLPVSFGDAISALNSFVAKLPDPLT